MTSEITPILTAKEAKKAKIGTPVTRPYPFTEANRRSIFMPVLSDFAGTGIPVALVIERYVGSTAIAAVWRGHPPKPARTSHQFRAQLYRDLSHTL
jgi:hypothetical protein